MSGAAARQDAPVCVCVYVYGMYIVHFEPGSKKFPLPCLKTCTLCTWQSVKAPCINWHVYAAIYCQALLWKRQFRHLKKNYNIMHYAHPARPTCRLHFYLCTLYVVRGHWCRVHSTARYKLYYTGPLTCTRMRVNIYRTYDAPSMVLEHI